MARRRLTATATAGGRRRERRRRALAIGVLACPVPSLLLLFPLVGGPFAAATTLPAFSSPPELIPAQPPPKQQQGSFVNGLAVAALSSASPSPASEEDGGQRRRRHPADGGDNDASSLLDPQLRVLDGARERLERAAAEAASRPGTARAAAPLSALAGQLGKLRRQLARLPAAWGLGDNVYENGDARTDDDDITTVDFGALLPPPNVTAASLSASSWLGAKGGFGAFDGGGKAAGHFLSSFQDAAWLCYADPFECWKRYGPVESGALRAALQAEAVRGVEAAAARRSRQLKGALDWAALAAGAAGAPSSSVGGQAASGGNASSLASSGRNGRLNKKNKANKRARVALDALLGEGGDAVLDAAVGALAALAAADAVVAFGEARVAAALRVASLLLPVRVALNPRAVVGQTLQLVLDAARTGARPASLFPFQTDGRVNNFQELAVFSAEAAVDSVTSGLNAVLAGFDAAARRWWRAPGISRGPGGDAGDEALVALATGPGGFFLRALFGDAGGGAETGGVPKALLPVLEEARRAVAGVEAAAAAAQTDDEEEERAAAGRQDDASGPAAAAAASAAAASDRGDSAEDEADQEEEQRQPPSLPAGLSALMLRAASSPSSSSPSAATTATTATMAAAAARRPLTDELRLTLGVAGDLFVEWARASARDLQRAAAAFDAAVPGPSPAEAVRLARRALAERGETARRALERAFPSADVLEAADVLRVAADEILAAAEEAASLTAAPDNPAVLAARDALTGLARGMRFVAGPLGTAADALFRAPPPLANATLAAVRALAQDGADEVDAAAARVRADYAPGDLAHLAPEALLGAARRAADRALGGAADAASGMVALLLERAAAVAAGGAGGRGDGSAEDGAEQARALADGLPGAMRPLVRAFEDALAVGGGGGGRADASEGAPPRGERDTRRSGFEREQRAWAGAAAALDGRAGAELRALARRIESLAEAVPVAQEAADAGEGQRLLRQQQQLEGALLQPAQDGAPTSAQPQQPPPPLGAGVAAAAALLEAAAAGRVSSARAALQGALMRLNAKNVEAEAEDEAAAAAAAAAAAEKAASAARAPSLSPQFLAAAAANGTAAAALRQPSFAARLNVVLASSADRAVRLSRSTLGRGAEALLVAQERGAAALRGAAAQATREAAALAAGLNGTVAPALAAISRRRRAAADEASLGIRENLSPLVKEGVRAGERAARGWLDAALAAVGVVGGVGGGGR